MKFYHGTNEETWAKIQQEGVLWGVRPLAPSRCTYLATDRAEATTYGNVVLEVEYDPNNKDDNYHPDAWQLRVYIPILINKLKRLK
jgi:hypothetical protein